MVILNYDFYSPTSDYFYSVEICIEFDAHSGVINPFNIDIQFYQSETLENSL